MVCLEQVARLVAVPYLYVELECEGVASQLAFAEGPDEFFVEGYEV